MTRPHLPAPTRTPRTDQQCPTSITKVIETTDKGLLFQLEDLSDLSSTSAGRVQYTGEPCDHGRSVKWTSAVAIDNLSFPLLKLDLTPGYLGWGGWGPKLDANAYSGYGGNPLTGPNAHTDVADCKMRCAADAACGCIHGRGRQHVLDALRLRRVEVPQAGRRVQRICALCGPLRHRGADTICWRVWREANTRWGRPTANQLRAFE